MYFVRINNNDTYARIFMENSKMQITLNIDSMEDAKVIGSKIHDSYAAINSKIKANDERMDYIFQEIKGEGKFMSEERNDSLNAQLEMIYEEGVEIVKEYINANPSSPVAAYLVNRQLIYDCSFEELSKWADGFQAAIPENKYTQLLVERRDILAKVQLEK